MFAYFFLNLHANIVMKILSFILIPIAFLIYTQNIRNGSNKITNTTDTSEIIELNNNAFKSRLINPNITITNAKKALQLSFKLNYINGIAESYRVIGVGNSYKNSIDISIENYLNALSYFKKSKNLEGEAKVYNNIGNLYRDLDLKKSLESFNKSLKIAEKLKNKNLLAGLYLNIGTANQQSKNYTKALSDYQKSLSMFITLNNKLGIIQSNQNMGVLYLNLGDYQKAEKHLSDALKNAKEEKLNNSIAAVNLTLSSIHIAQSRFSKAEKTINEGLLYAKLLKDTKLEYNFTIVSYELENKRKNYFQALNYLQKAYKQDSAKYANNISEKISLLETQHIQLEKQKENELTIAKQKNTQILFWASSAIAAMAFLVIFLLIKNVRKSANTNKVLTRLNLEISKQKDDLDRANQNLEEIIDDRTKDLKVKNKKLSEYSSHLSHQIRSPVATLKGLMFLEKDNLIEKDEFVEQLGYCINDLDDKIININENLNNPGKSGLIDND
ncbi:Tetratricopeptide repeat-containing protein [Daejeonella rubra]|uniref:Tetratricopeptide repeat-containing protein n=1 Tax=Daejeonella rubra TaxID=990371 RepID=A0A1G9N652_9SPHI|nr:tetratricopeptide repeat protein [Daejeonella rubra]SDL81325.1 Tetratricopeptide repeat-containing protein [Daejeonella rubra]